MRKVLLTVGALVLLVAGCTSKQSGVALSAPDFFGPDAFRGLTVGMSKQEALGTGRLGKAPTSTLYGCEDYSFTGGPKPDPAQMADEQAAERKANEVKSRLDAAKLAHKPLADNPTLDELRKSADELGVIAQIMQESLEATRQLSQKSSARNVKFLAAGGGVVRRCGQVTAGGRTSRS
ncbi:outer membrane murein-binding lipoprotein Lpp [Kibdelosporangium banguiense]|uniref:Outer membrane murein-binding lipoprotein Lpp n=1 Tax=Kibdelosporangium banguiense TaxID=1365924 RepID=A0ABS4THS7_9PSEU|nr:hypothetical protein [Kibdelosporangium banguiense]MBP2323559.1 outer membrane murein-binding lipoprotein Lpp [Kibdelosporangium banguiense]